MRGMPKYYLVLGRAMRHDNFTLSQEKSGDVLHLKCWAKLNLTLIYNNLSAVRDLWPTHMSLSLLRPLDFSCVRAPIWTDLSLGGGTNSLKSHESREVGRKEGGGIKMGVAS